MQSIRSLVVAGLASFVAAAFGAGASADPIVVPVANASFESPDSTGWYQGAIDGWTKSGYENYVGVVDESLVHSAGFPDAVDGTQYLNITTEGNTGGWIQSVHQNVGPILAGSTYTLSAYVGATDTVALSNFKVGLYTSPDRDELSKLLDENAALAVKTQADGVPGAGQWQLVTMTWDSTGALVGQDLYVILEGSTYGTSRVLFDNVSLSVIPEPASLALLGVGGLLMLGRRRAA